MTASIDEARGLGERPRPRWKKLTEEVQIEQPQ